jgi:hypothetical protein
VTTTAGLATLLFALAGLSLKAHGAFVLNDDAQTALGLALIGFVLAGGVGLATNAPLKYNSVKVDDIRGRLRENPIRDSDAAELDVALTRVKTLKRAKSKNQCKARLLTGAIALEVIATALIGVAAWDASSAESVGGSKRPAIVGPTGPQGKRGLPGRRGPRGLRGPRGAPGDLP